MASGAVLSYKGRSAEAIVETSRRSTAERSPKETSPTIPPKVGRSDLHHLSRLESFTSCRPMALGPCRSRNAQHRWKLFRYKKSRRQLRRRAARHDRGEKLAYADLVHQHWRPQILRLPVEQLLSKDFTSLIAPSRSIPVKPIATSVQVPLQGEQQDTILPERRRSRREHGVFDSEQL